MSLRVWMLIQNFYPHTGGAERQCLKLSRELVKNGVQVRVITKRSDSSLKKNDRIDTIPVHRLRHVRPFELAAIWWFFYLLIHHRKYDVLHVHMLDEHTLGAVMVGLICKKPVIVKFANSGTFFDPLRLMEYGRFPINTLIVKSLKYATRYISIASAVKKDLLTWRFPGKKIVAIPNGVDIPLGVSRSEKMKLREKLNLPRDAFLVLRVGSYLEHKGAILLFRAWKKVLRNIGNAFLISVGGDGIPQQINDLCGEYPENVRLVLNQPNGVTDYLQVADLFVLPSRAEGLSNALLEAMAYGLPSVVTRVGGNVDLVDDGVTGRIVDPEDSEQISGAIISLLENPPLLRKMGRAARQKVSEFSLEAVAECYVELYEQLLNE